MSSEPARRRRTPAEAPPWTTHLLTAEGAAYRHNEPPLAPAIGAGLRLQVDPALRAVGLPSALVLEHLELSSCAPAVRWSSRYRKPPVAVIHPSDSERPMRHSTPRCITTSRIVIPKVSPARWTDLILRRVVGPRRLVEPVVAADRAKVGVAVAHSGCAFQ